MVTPEEARKLADLTQDDYCSCLPAYKDRGMFDPQCQSCMTHDERHECANALRDLATQVESLQEELAEKTCSDSSDMTLEQAMNLGKLWAAGKLIGGDAYAVAAVLASHVESLQADAERLAFINEKLEWDGHGYWMPEWCIVGIEGQQEMIEHPSIDKFREAIDEARKQS